ncbi:MAG: hypothetical protein WD002_02570 [Pseudomonadales bacterium]
MKPWVTRPIVAMWLLWSGMFLCLLPPETSAMVTDSSSSRMEMPVHQHAKASTGSTDCIEVDSDTADVSCKSEAGGKLIFSSLDKFIAITNHVGYRLPTFVPFDRQPIFFPATLPPDNPPVYLIVCSFLI